MGDLWIDQLMLPFPYTLSGLFSFRNMDLKQAEAVSRLK